MSNEIKLLPCAHCGAPAEFKVCEESGLLGMDYVECTNPTCGICTQLMQPIGEAVDGKLAEIWNSRSNLIAPEDDPSSPDFIPDVNMMGLTPSQDDGPPYAEERDLQWQAKYQQAMETWAAENVERDQVHAHAVSACERIMDAIAGHTDWHPSPHVDAPDWNEQAHIEVTITVGDCRALKRVLEAAGKLDRYL